MADWQPSLARKEALCEVEARIKLDPESIALRFERACLLNEIGHADDAKQAYLDVLEKERQLSPHTVLSYRRELEVLAVLAPKLGSISL